MSRLTKGMYGNEFRNASKLFGLGCGQMVCDSDYVHNAGWYNGDGQKLGWGDLSFKQMKRIAGELASGEVFLVLGEQDSFWNFVEKYGMIGWMCKTSKTEQEPGIEYVISHARYVILPGRVIAVVHAGYGNDSEEDQLAEVARVMKYYEGREVMTERCAREAIGIWSREQYLIDMFCLSVSSARTVLRNGSET